MKKYVAEFIGTMVLVIMGCGTSMLVGVDAASGSRVIIVTRASSNDGDWVLEPLLKNKYALVCLLE